MSSVSAQIHVDQFDLTIESKFSEEVQANHQQFLNEHVCKIALVKLKKKYSHASYYRFLRSKKFYQSRKKWIRENAYDGSSVIMPSDDYPLLHSDSFAFEDKFTQVDMEFVGTEVFLDSSETKLILCEMFNGEKNDYMDLCYAPRHAVLFYNRFGEVTGIYEICFDCGNVKLGTVGVDLISKSSPYIQSLFTKYKDNLE